MNEYGRHVRDHYRRFLPVRYGQIPDPETHFSILGQQIQDEVLAAETQLTGADPQDESYLAKVGRLNMARLQARELVLTRFVPEPEPDLIEDLDPEDNPAATQMLAWARQDQHEQTEHARNVQEQGDSARLDCLTRPPGL